LSDEKLKNLSSVIDERQLTAGYWGEELLLYKLSISPRRLTTLLCEIVVTVVRVWTSTKVGDLVPTTTCDIRTALTTVEGLGSLSQRHRAARSVLISWILQPSI